MLLQFKCKTLDMRDTFKIRITPQSYICGCYILCDRRSFQSSILISSTPCALRLIAHVNKGTQPILPFYVASLHRLTQWGL